MYAGVQTIPIDQEIADVISKEMSKVKPQTVYSKYEYRPASKTNDLLTIIKSQRREILTLQKELEVSKLEMRKLEARLQIIENKMDKNYTLLNY